MSPVALGWKCQWHHRISSVAGDALHRLARARWRRWREKCWRASKIVAIIMAACGDVSEACRVVSAINGGRRDAVTAWPLPGHRNGPAARISKQWPPAAAAIVNIARAAVYVYRSASC